MSRVVLHAYAAFPRVAVLRGGLATGLLIAGMAVSAPAQTTTEVHEGRGGSPHVKTSWTLDGATISITYGRPYAKGRQVFGSLVPYGEVWRTGADEATTLETSADLDIGGTEVPAGTYTLYTLPDQSDCQLIVNKETGQFGTEYAQEDDLARIDMEHETLPATVEQLTVNLAPQTDGGGLLTIDWETTRVSVPVAVKK